MKRLIYIFLLLAFYSIGCGTYSLLRPADLLKPRQVDLQVGSGFSQLEVVPVDQLAIGVTKWLELNVHYETYSALAGVRFGLLNSKKHKFALSLSAGGGWFNVYNSKYIQGGGAYIGLTLGRRFKWFEPYLGYKGLVMMNIGGWWIHTAKLGVRFNIGKHFLLGLEGGVTTHHGFWTMAEGAGTIGLKF